jgi:hypothetical protein
MVHEETIAPHLFLACDSAHHGPVLARDLRILHGILMHRNDFDAHWKSYFAPKRFAEQTGAGYFKLDCTLEQAGSHHKTR